MKENQMITNINGHLLSMPIELYDAMGKPRGLIIAPESLSNSNVFICMADRPLFCLIKNLVLGFVGKVVKKYSSQAKVAYLIKLENDRAVFIHALKKYDNTYHIVNYHPHYWLTPVSSSKVQESREIFWATIQSYHEHLDPEAQDASAHKVSQWLASNVLRSFHPLSILELGCGAGRNLMYFNKEMPDTLLYGIDINKDAVTTVRKNIPSYDSNINVGSIYNTQKFDDNSIDIVFTSGVLMHIPHESVREIMKEMFRIARVAIINFELHGPSHNFDYHRYPRDYSQVYKSLFPGIHVSYEIYPKGDYRTDGTSSFNHALVVIRK